MTLRKYQVAAFYIDTSLAMPLYDSVKLPGMEFSVHPTDLGDYSERPWLKIDYPTSSRPFGNISTSFRVSSISLCEVSHTSPLWKLWTRQRTLACASCWKRIEYSRANSWDYTSVRIIAHQRVSISGEVWRRSHQAVCNALVPS